MISAVDPDRRHVHKNRTAYREAFKAQVGCPPATYLLQWRVALAQSMLRQGRSVKEAADALGYASAASFSRAFTQQAGQPPTAWRQVQA